MKKLLFVLLITSLLSSCDILQGILNTASDTMNDSESGLSISEMVEGLKSSLTVGTENSVNLLGKDGGFLNDKTVRIPFPQEIIKVKETLEKAGLSNLVEKFEEELNKGASHAVNDALPIFKKAITDMSIADAKNILLGENDAATKYFKTKTTSGLYNAFKPKVTDVLDKFGVNKAYTTMMTAYNKIPLVSKQNTDLPDYVTNKAMDGLFLKITKEEAKIRGDLGARVNSILTKVFGWVDSQKQ